MKLSGWKRTVLGGMLALSVVGSTLAPVVAGHAAAGGRVDPGGANDDGALGGCACAMR